MSNEDEVLRFLAKHEVELDMVVQMLQQVVLHSDAIADRLVKAEKDLEKVKKELAQISLVN